MDPIYTAIDALSEAALGDFAEGDLDDLALRLDSVRRIAVLAKELEGMLELAVLEAMPSDTVRHPAIGIVRKVPKRSKKLVENGTAKFQSDLSIAIARKLGTDPYTGEVSADRREAARDAVRLVTDCVTVSGSSVKLGATALGIDPDDYVTYSTHYAVEISNREESV